MLSLLRPLLSASVSPFGQLGGALRWTSKTHRATYKRWRKIGGAAGFKRGIQGRKHGNAGFNQSLLKKRTGTAYANSMQKEKLSRLLPHL
ncbi:Mrp35 protein [Martiniozyma asiatica (nom. inval.)]|nr:Mrp35 protein [Martiniozyma asiatica]